MPAPSRFTVVLDPGHGGASSAAGAQPLGVVGRNGAREKDLALDLALRLERALARRPDVRVVLTRRTDVSLPLAARARVAKDEGADVFLSLHFGGGAPTQNQSLAYAFHQPPARPAAAPDLALARALRRALCEATGLRDSPGVLGAPLAVLDPTALGPRAAACLLEVSTLSDPHEEQRLTGPTGAAYRDAIAAHLASALAALLARRGGEATVAPALAGGPVEHRFVVASREHFDLWHEVPLVPQLTGMSCWAASAAMLLGWRDSIPVDPVEVARGAGRWGAYRDGLEPRDVPELARAWGLKVAPERPRAVADFRRLLQENGPLWVGEASPGLHSVVVAGIAGDGTPDGTWIRVADPWPKDRGERYRVTFREFSQNLQAAEELGGPHAHVLHTGGRRPTASASHAYRFQQSITASFDGAVEAAVPRCR